MSAHVDSELLEYLLGMLGSQQARAVDVHLEACPGCTGALRQTSEALSLLTLVLPRVAPSRSLRARVLATVRSPQHRLAPFVARLAVLTQLSPCRAEALLARASDPHAWEPAPWPNVTWIHVEGGPGLANADVGFVKMPAGAVFPHHVHVGDEEVLVLQGTLQEEDGRVLKRGQMVRHPAGSAHGFRAAGSVDLVTAVVARGLQF